MNFKREINAFRRAAMQRLTKNVGQSTGIKKSNAAQQEIRRVLICRPNHRLGNLLLMTPLVQDVTASFPNCTIDLLVKGNLAPSVFKNYSNINRYIELPKKPFKDFTKYIQGWLSIRQTNYDMVINVVKGSSSGRLTAQFAHAKYKFFGDDGNDTTKYFNYQHLAKQPVYQFRNYLLQLGFVENSQPVPLLDIKLSPTELSEGKRKLQSLVKNEKKTICLFTYATGDKCYPKSWWEKFYERLKKEYPNYNIIEILPVENISMISFQAPTYSHKDIRDVGSVIANTAVFIGADSGVMHLASSVQVPTIGLFSITDPEAYAPYNTQSVGINTNESDVDDYIKALNQIINR